jgi:hypothetical protein
MKRKLYVVFITFALLAGLYSCTKDRTAVPAPVVCTGIVDTLNTFSKNIYPNILGLYCAYAPCHGGGSASDLIDFSTYSSTVAAFQSNNVICALTLNSGCTLMPNGGPPLDSLSLQEIKCWQANGYLP